MPHSYAPQFRAMVIEQFRSGRKVEELARELEVSPATVYRWLRQDRVDRGELVGTSNPRALNCVQHGVGSPSSRRNSRP